ncbi:MAG TPA: hypothetical protein ENK85_07440 [Saprospiraceae bacterium]|nr:hypothetical protein [Saprospiraceae bacterium]
MQETDVIIVDGIDKDTYLNICREAVEYAVISIPFTYNRMGIRNLKKKISNIAKGKLAEGLFFYFCESNQIPIDKSIGQTPFYMPDKTDFVFQNAEWDIKNNFLYHKGNYLFKKYYKWLPGLIPHKSATDQWAKRNKLALSSTTEKRYLFTFLKAADSLDERKQLIDIHLSEKQEKYLTELCHQFRNNRRSKEQPFDASSFWHQFYQGENRAMLFRLKDFPQLIITGYAGPHQWHHFKDSGENRIWNNGLMRTVINNSYSRIHKLPAFASLVPHLKEGMERAHFSHPKGRRNPYLS